jgi:hypothetical protein
MDPEAGVSTPTVGQRILNTVLAPLAALGNDITKFATGKDVSGARVGLGARLLAGAMVAATFMGEPEGEAAAAADAGRGAISMDEAVARAADHVGGEGVMEVSGSKNFQFRNTSVDEAGNTVQKIGRMDVNPDSPHVQAVGPHLNLETQVNRVSDPKLDPHTPIDPKTVRPGDYPKPGDK